MTPAAERRAHPRSWFLLGQAHLVARMRTGTPLRVLNASQDGMLVESPVRLLPGRCVDVVLHSASGREHAPWLVVHSRVGCLRGRSDLRYRAGLRRSLGMNYSQHHGSASNGHSLPTESAVKAADSLRKGPKSAALADGTGIGRPDHS